MIQTLRAELQAEKKLRLALEAQVRLLEQRLTRNEGNPPWGSLDRRLFRVETWVREVTAGMPAHYDGRVCELQAKRARPKAAGKRRAATRA